MAITSFNPTIVSGLLLDAWRSGKLLTEVPADNRPMTLEQGYDAQDALFAASGGHRAGWKLGVGSPALMRSGGLSRPLVGQLDEKRIHSNGAHLRMPSADLITVECEVAFVLARAIPPTVGREPQPEDVKYTCVTFELVRSRFIDRRAVGWPSFTADNVGFEALVVSEPLDFGLDITQLRQLNDSVVVSLDGVEKAKALDGENATDPLRSLSGLFAHAADRGVTLRAGEIVSTGAMCQPFDISGSDHTVTATFMGHDLTFTV